MTSLDLNIFAGAGGLALGLREAGFSPDLLCEADEHACRTLRENFITAAYMNPQVERTLVEDYPWKQIDRPVRLIAAGVPCQPFSIAGNGMGHQDYRNCFPLTLEIVKWLRPAAILIENVPGLLRPAVRPYFDFIVASLRSLLTSPHTRNGETWRARQNVLLAIQNRKGYDPDYLVDWKELDAADYGVPQRRRRLFIVAVRRGLGEFHFPKPTHSKSRLIEDQKGGEYWKRHDLRPRTNCAAVANTPSDSQSENELLPWVTARDAIKDLPEPADKEVEASMNHWVIPGARSYRGHTGSDPDLPAKTVKAGVHGVPGGENTLILDDGGVRYFTLRELARIQTFPDAHSFFGARKNITKQIGNAVPCRLARILGCALLSSLNGK